MPWPSRVVSHFANNASPFGGPGNVIETNILSDLPQPDPTRFHTYLEDFDYYTAADWTVTTTASITATQALTSADGGVLLLQFTTTNDDAIIALQKVGNDFLMESGKTFFFKTRLAISSISADFVAGLQITDTTPQGVSDGAYFYKSSAAATVDFIIRRNATTGTTSAAAFTTVSADSYVTLSFYYDGASTVWYGAYDQVMGSLNVDASLPDALLTPSFAIISGGSANVSAPSLSMDFMYAAKERSSVSER